jgi:outer membrane immunogenic protein
MKSRILAAALSLGLVAPAFAGDLPAAQYSASASYIPIYYDWSGFYLGANGGYGLAHDCLRVGSSSGNLLDEGCHDGNGGIVGGQVGYRWQFGGAPMVFGLEAEGDWANLRGSHVSFLDPTITNRTELNGFGLFTAQFGYALNNVLFYLKGGAALTSDRYEDLSTFGGTVLGAVSQTRWGGTAGLGAEYGFTPNWTAGLEYDHLFMGGRNFNLAGPLGFVATEQITRDVDLFTARVIYKFGGPVVSRF